MGENDLFIAPGAMSDFIPRSATGKARPLPRAVQDAIALGKISDQPMPGFVLIRDPKLLDALTTSNKLWKGAAELEGTLPTGRVVPPPSQLLYTRMASGQRVTIAVIGQPISCVQLDPMEPILTFDLLIKCMTGARTTTTP